MAQKHDFVVVGSGGGGGTIAWLLAKAGYDVLLLEQGPDLAGQRDPAQDYDPKIHNEFFYRLKKPDPKRRRRGDYNTFLERDKDSKSKPFQNGWTASVLGGGSVLWGTWAFRALPIDFRLRTHFANTGQLAGLEAAGYSVHDWPIHYSEMLPYFSVAEALMGVSGDRNALNKSIRASDWYQRFKGENYWGPESHWFPSNPYPLESYTRTPVGQFFYDGYESVAASWKAFSTPMAIVKPGKDGFKTRDAIASAVASQNGGLQGEFWSKNATEIWSDQVRQACNMCGFCGEYLCWGKTGPKWGTQDTTLKELATSGKLKIQTDAKAIEVITDQQTKRATGVAFLDLKDPNNPKLDTDSARADFVIVSCGAVQTARLLLLSGRSAGLGNSSGQLGANATFHMFGLGVKATLSEKFQGLLHGELGPTGNTSTFATYFMKDGGSDTWIKGGHLTSAAKKNPLEDAVNAYNGDPTADLLKTMTNNNRQLEVRLTADDLPMTENRVTLDPNYVDEYGVPVARISRKKGDNEVSVDRVGIDYMNRVYAFYQQKGVVSALSPSKSILKLIGDHQMGTCRMSNDPSTSVLNRFCRMHDVENVFVVDSSFMPTGLGLNPMVTVVANALRVGSHIVDALKKGEKPGAT